MDHPSWDQIYMNMCYEIAELSPDESTRSGCYIASQDNMPISFACNDFPRGIANTPERQERPAKYQYIEHAERNAISDAGRAGNSCIGAKLYMNWLPCTPCARGIIQAGITNVIIHQQGQAAFKMSRNESVWDADHDEVLNMFAEAKVEFHWFHSTIRAGLAGMGSGKYYDLSGTLPVEIPKGSAAIWIPLHD
jgi:dCMP deaminase